MEGFRGAPRFLAYPRAFTVQSGTDAVLSCQITGDPQPSIIWEKDKTPIEPSGRFHMEAKGDLYSLLVSHTTPQDSGLYICKAKNSVGETYAAATLKVEAGKPQEEERCSGSEAPSFLVAPSSTRVCRGEDVMFACRVSGQPCPVLEWEKDGHKLSDLFESSHFAVGQEPEDWHFLKLFGARPPDGGVYVCRARSGSREALAAAVLLQRRRHTAERRAGPETWVPNGVVPAGVPGAKAFAVSVGKHAKFRCYVTGKPKPEIVWQKDGEPLAPGRRHLVYEDREGYFILKVLYCKPQDQGLYVCTASNTAGQTLSAVQLHVKEHRLQFQVQLADVEVAEQEDAVLECQVPLETIPTAWYLEDRELQPSHKYVMEERGVVRRLTIRDARTDDDGIYLCQMKDKGRSIAELSVRGMIVKRLPRKLDVMEGENAVFCVETREAVEGTCWSRDGLQLRESPHTVLKSFGRTHLLVLVHVTRQDVGIISFTVGESQTSSQLRVKCVKRDPPSTPVAAEMSVAESNAALLAWCPAPDAHLRPPSRYLLERREVAGGEWVQCLATDLPGRMRVLGDSVPREADYCFRVCATNEHGRSSPVEFPGSVHLGEGAPPGCWLSPEPARMLCHGTLLVVTTGAESSCAPAPAAHLERGLQDVRVQDGEDARFSLELSAMVNGTWFLDGTRLGEEEEACGRCSVRHHGMEHSLLIRGARVADSGAQVTFVSGEVMLLTPLLLLRSAGPLDTGVYTCDAGDDAVSFVVTVTEAPVRIVSSNEEAPHTYMVGQRVELWCQLSRPAVPVHWYKDGEEVEVGESLVLEQEGPRHRLVLPCARPQDTGEFVCDAGGDSVFYTITVAEPPVRILHPAQRSLELPVQVPGRVELRCKLSVPDAPVRWFKDGLEVDETDNLLLLAEGPWRCLLIPRSSAEDEGEYICESKDEAVSFDVKVSGKWEPRSRETLMVLWPQDWLLHGDEASGCPPPGHPDLVLEVHLSHAHREVKWYKDGEKLQDTGHVRLEEDGAHRSLVVLGATGRDAGEYLCDTGDDSIVFFVTVEGEWKVRGGTARGARTEVGPWLLPDLCEAGLGVNKHGELSRPDATVRWLRDGQEVQPGERVQVKACGVLRQLTVCGVQPSDAGCYVCDAASDCMVTSVEVLEAPVLFVNKREEQEKLLVLEGGSAVLSAVASTDRANITWLGPQRAAVAGERCELRQDGRVHSLILHNVAKEDAGTYTCLSPEDQMQFDLSVRELRVKFLRGLSDVRVQQGERAVLWCELCKARGDVVWRKDGRALAPGPRRQMMAEGRERSLVLSRVQPEDAGEYCCESNDDQTLATLTVQGELCPKLVLEGEDATFKCLVSPEDVAMIWQLNGQPMVPSKRLLVTRSGLCHSLTLRQCQPGDAGTVTANAEGLVSTARLSVQEAQVLFVRKLRDKVAEEQGDVCLEVEVSHEAAEVQWLKQGILLQPGSKYQLQELGSGRRRVLQLSRCETADAGIYTCDAGDCRASAMLHVKGTATQLLGVQEGDNAIFTCEASHGDVKGEWFRDGEKIKVSSTVKIRQEGTRHFLLLCGVHPKDAGLICFAAGAAVSEASLRVEALPIRIVKPLRDKTVLARHKATLECTVSHARGRVRWLRGDTEIFASDKYEICNLDCYRTLIIHRVGPEDEDSYTCDAFDDRSTARLLVEGEGAPGVGDGHTSLGAGSVTTPHSGRTAGALSPCPTACRGLSTGVGRAAWISDQGSVPPLSGTPPLGAPPAPRMLLLSLMLIAPAGS
uniref:Obscurin-like protein 1 n=1 Tax=Athene cunicularia TaxID=194338 RepID=A0A663MVW4_ATHCN